MKIAATGVEHAPGTRLAVLRMRTSLSRARPHQLPGDLFFGTPSSAYHRIVAEVSHRWRGTVVIAGYAGGRVAGVDVADIIWKAATIRGFSFRLFSQQTVAAANAALLEFLKEGALQPMVDKVFPMSEAAEAVRHLIEDRAFGRVLWTCSISTSPRSLN